MRLYSELPARRTTQVLADVGMVAWVVAWVLVGRWVHDTALTLAAPGHRLVEAGSGFRGRMTQAADSVDGLPLLDDRVAAPFRSAAGAGTTIEHAGQDLVDAVGTFATVLWWTTTLVPVLVVGLVWLVLRVRFVRRATAAQRFVDGAPDLDLFALRAMANQPMPRLARVSDDPVGAWRAGDRDTIRRLALLELREVGLRPPPEG